MCYPTEKIVRSSSLHIGNTFTNDNKILYWILTNVVLLALFQCIIITFYRYQEYRLWGKTVIIIIFSCDWICIHDSTNFLLPWKPWIMGTPALILFKQAPWLLVIFAVTEQIPPQICRVALNCVCVVTLNFGVNTCGSKAFINTKTKTFLSRWSQTDACVVWRVYEPSLWVN